MKTIRYLYSIALSLAFSISYAQTSSVDYTVAAAAEQQVLAQNNTFTSSETEPTASIGKPEVKIYPEPFSGIVSVNLNNCPGAKICVFDAKGKCLKFQDCKNEDCAIFNLRNEPKGIYYMEIMVQGQKTVKSIYLNQNF